MSLGLPSCLPLAIWQYLLPLKPKVLSRPHPRYSSQPIKGNLTLFFKCEDPVDLWGSAYTLPLWPQLSILTLFLCVWLTATVKPLAPHPCPPPHHKQLWMFPVPRELQPEMRLQRTAPLEAGISIIFTRKTKRDSSCSHVLAFVIHFTSLSLHFLICYMRK